MTVHTLTTRRPGGLTHLRAEAPPVAARQHAARVACGRLLDGQTATAETLAEANVTCQNCRNSYAYLVRENAWHVTASRATVQVNDARAKLAELAAVADLGPVVDPDVLDGTPLNLWFWWQDVAEQLANASSVLLKLTAP